MTRRTVMRIMGIHIKNVEVPHAVLVKINNKHGVTEDEVMDVCYAVRPQARWDLDADRGLRLFVRGRTENGRLIRVILWPVDVGAGQFRLVTAIVVGTE